MNDPLDNYALDLRKSTAPPNHIAVSSLYSVTAPQYGTVTGVKGCYSPPYAAGELQFGLDLVADGHKVEDTGNLGKRDCGLLFAGAVWRPDRIVRRGTYHWLKEEGLVSLGVISELVPLTGKAGFVLAVRVTNRCDRSVALEIMPRLEPGSVRKVPLGAWNFSPPVGGTIPKRLGDESVWENEAVRISVYHDRLSAIMSPGQEYAFRIAVVLTDAGRESPLPNSLADWAKETEERWRGLIARSETAMPRLETDIPGLEAYYRRSLISGLICLWDHPEFKIRPFPVTSGIDGGGINNYPWDAAGYVGQTLTMLLGSEGSLQYLRFMEEGGIDRHICFAPDGTGYEPFAYSYSLWAFFHFAWSLFSQHGVIAELYPVLRRVLEIDEERLLRRGELLDYGNHHHLLEMRGSGYEHVVASPNAERAWCYDRLAELAAHLGLEEAEGWRGKSARIRRAIREDLWDDEAKWFRSLYPGGHREIVYSIQAYDALRMGACTPEMERALLSHLRDGAFLGQFGVSSISAEDELHYELNDPDWSGGGSFGGEGPILAQTLWEIGRPELAWDVLKRHLWIGARLPYVPQEHYCDRPAVPAHKRANNISGMAGSQAIIFGMAGIRPQLDGSLHIHPQPPEEGRVSLIGYDFRGHLYDVHMAPGHCRIVRDGSEIYSGVPELRTIGQAAAV
ncbi:MGH1-like glycoside hydrolase domain-containing protein [Paenibacillus glycinis]|uniref:Mannosylglycerate hydrolase MGH1-like glycoside hydrolase domain-containing protein n=1 Tax=Paenibacillus glycinis TaxID=2697035 RepID=A0ABW9XUC6_9BACL|nr:hypothetical protein [Paenibacillus glycinis]NBD26282.1 hypothetical protein [Paenibacillus glycinis]